MEIERRFLVADPSRLPALGTPMRLLQCYLPRSRVEVGGGVLLFEGSALVSGLEQRVCAQLSELMEGRFAPRVRLQDERAFVTLKGETVRGARPEFEWEVARATVEGLVLSFVYSSVQKRRHVLPAAEGLCWEVDFFEGENHGLVMAEIELPSIDHPFDKPDWLGLEVTDDGRYANASLARDPVADWD